MKFISYMNRRGLELAFGMIFSIIMIITIVGVASYVIVHFLEVGKVSQLSLFHQNFQETVNDIWASSITNKVVSFDLPSGITQVCFGNLSESRWNPNYRQQRDDFIRYSSTFDRERSNRFIYPTEKSGDFALKKVDKIDLSGFDGFDCIEVKDRKLRVRMIKDNFNPLVKVEAE